MRLGDASKCGLKLFHVYVVGYREHPEAKFLGHDGKPCDSLTRGLLRRSHIVAKKHRYIGKETSRCWEQGEDMDLVDFRCAEFAEGKVIASNEIRKQIVEIGIRKVARETGLHSDTVTLIARGIPVKPSTLQTVIKFFDEKRN